MEEEQKQKKPFYKRWWFIALVVVFIIGAIGGDADDDEEVVEEDTEEVAEAPTEEAEEDVEEPEEPEDTFDNQFEAAAHEVFGDNLEELYVSDEENPVVEVTAMLQSNLTMNMTRESANMDIRDYLESVENEAFSEISFYFDTTLVDQYGNEEVQNVIDSIFTKETVDNINFENFNRENIPNVADYWWTHTAIQD